MARLYVLRVANILEASIRSVALIVAESGRRVLRIRQNAENRIMSVLAAALNIFSVARIIKLASRFNGATAVVEQELVWEPEPAEVQEPVGGEAEDLDQVRSSPKRTKLDLIAKLNSNI